MVSEPSTAREDCPSNLTLDRWRAHELSVDDAREVREHLGACRRCAARAAWLAQQAESFLASPSAQSSLRAIVAQRASTVGLPRTFWAAGSLLAAAAAVVLLFPRSHTESVRRKGSHELGFFVKRGERLFRGADGEHVLPRDQLRFTAHPAHPVELAIFGVDGRGTVSLYYPVLGASQHLTPGSEEQALAASVELDDVLGDERIFGLFCEAAQPLEAIRRELEAEGTLHERPGCRIDTLHLHKKRGRP